jgi:hypothetical protein
MAASVLSEALTFALGTSALALAIYTAALTPSVKSLIQSKEGQAFLKAGWAERNLIRRLAFTPKKELTDGRTLIGVVDELQTPAGYDLIAATLNLTKRDEVAAEIPRASARLKKAVRDWLRANAKTQAAVAELQTYGRSLESIVDDYVDDAIRDLINARDAYPPFSTGSEGLLSEKPLERLGEILDRFFERHPLPDLSFVKIYPDRASESAIAVLNASSVPKQVTSLNFQKTVAPPGGLKVSVRIDGQTTDGIVAVGGLEFLRELEANERCYVDRYRSANGYPIVFSYRKGRDLIAAPACLSTDLIGGTKFGPLAFQPVTVVDVPLIGQVRPNLADEATRKAVFASTAKKLSGALWVLPPKTGLNFLGTLERLFPVAMQKVIPQLPASDRSVWTSTREHLLAAGGKS